MFFQKAYDGRNAWWRWLATIIITIGIWLLVHVPVVGFIEATRQRLALGPEAFANGVFPEGVDRNLFLFLMLLPFVIGFFTLWLCVRWIHRKPLTSVLTGRPRFDWGRAFFAFALWMVISAIGTFAVLPASAYSYQFDPAAFWPMLAIALLMIPIQCAFEEVFVRGYLLQGFSLILKNKIAPLILVTVLFTAAHFGNPEFAAEHITVLAVYVVISVLFGICAVLDDGLEVSIGLHAATNIFLAVVMSPVDGSIATYSLFTTRLAEVLKFSPHADIVQAVIGFGILFYVYGWRFSTLFAPTMPCDEPEPAQV
jgi:membrane protease YdiL (CAAX protease family)